jgi:hypothetical protein
MVILVGQIQCFSFLCSLLFLFFVLNFSFQTKIQTQTNSIEFSQTKQVLEHEIDIYLCIILVALLFAR